MAASLLVHIYKQSVLCVTAHVQLRRVPCCLPTPQNHDFDYGLANLLKLNAQCKFPWLMANVLDKETGA